MSAADAAINEAVAWAIRLRERDFDDWASFSSWLAVSPDHAAAYREVVLTDEEAGGLFAASSLHPAPPRGDRYRATGRHWGVGLAVAGVAIFAIYSVLPKRADFQVLATAPGQQKLVTLEPGTTIALNGDTQLRFEAARPRVVLLDRGQAVFSVRHDRASPFEVRVSGHVLRDAGTRFEVERTRGGLNCAVAEGGVVIDPGGRAHRLSTGAAVSINSRGETARHAIDPAEVGDWRKGRLFFDGAPLADVAAEISRTLGVQVEARPRAADFRINAAIVLSRRLRDDPRELGPLLGVAVGRSGDRWVLDRRR